jgi:hypothetical protein
VGRKMVTGWLPLLLDWRVMGLADDLIVKDSTPKLCPFGRMRAKLDDKDRGALDDVLKQIDASSPQIRSAVGGVTIAWLHGALRKNDIRIGRQSINDHLKGACCCESL